MFCAPNTGSRLCGTYQVCVNCSKCAKVHSGVIFLDACSGMWTFQTTAGGRPQQAELDKQYSRLASSFARICGTCCVCVCNYPANMILATSYRSRGRKLSAYPRGRQQNASGMAVYLECVGTQPTKAAMYQIWLHNHRDASRTITHGVVVCLC